MRLTVEQADRLAQERPPYPPPSDVPAERCPGPTGWHRPRVSDWNQGNRESACTYCHMPIRRNFTDPVWRSPGRPDAPQVTGRGEAGALCLVTAISADFHGKSTEVLFTAPHPV